LTNSSNNDTTLNNLFSRRYKWHFKH
jgi:hypothetical protein